MLPAAVQGKHEDNSERSVLLFDLVGSRAERLPRMKGRRVPRKTCLVSSKKMQVCNVLQTGR